MGANDQCDVESILNYAKKYAFVSFKHKGCRIFRVRKYIDVVPVKIKVYEDT
ncbi:hypothetical protein IMZ38_01925 [Thermosphaera chiliense]|uniref:Uncharacterized protein n=1 Tax=Thermosphaera chiliense TaxID=3402707 RepID=A0A7M1URQ1_9CREN|nr:hypothetical protein [Thermosphaera aggregans]QOR94716.1 hypothetical protein IMZ38_01925 [Thermosphaera aggregans]